MRAAVLLLLGILAGPAAAAESYPGRTVEIVVPYGPGGTGDIIARQLARKFEEQFGKAFIVVNKPGGAGILGASSVARAQADGHSLLLGYTLEIAIAPFLGATGYETSSFEPIAIAGETPLLLIGRKTLAANTMRELIEVLRSSPQPFTYAGTGRGAPSHLAGELLKRQAKLDIRQVPYRGGAQAVADVLGGHVDIYFSGMPPAVPLVRNGDIKAFAVTGERRSSALPDVPTMTESGFASFDLSGWFALFAPKGTPAGVLEQLRAATRSALSDKSVQETLNQNGVDVRPNPTERVREFIDAESGKYRNLIAELGIEAEK